MEESLLEDRKEFLERRSGLGPLGVEALHGLIEVDSDPVEFAYSRESQGGELGIG